MVKRRLSHGTNGCLTQLIGDSIPGKKLRTRKSLAGNNVNYFWVRFGGDIRLFAALGNDLCPSRTITCLGTPNPSTLYRAQVTSSSARSYSVLPTA